MFRVWLVPNGGVGSVALAALHSGCFLRSQYCAYSGHSREAARLFVGSLMERRIAAEHDAGLCRLTSKAIYRALGAGQATAARCQGPLASRTRDMPCRRPRRCDSAQHSSLLPPLRLRTMKFLKML